MPERMKEKYDVGVVIGRFQVPNLTKAHIQLIEDVKKSHASVIVMIGIAQTLGTKKDPLPYIVREQMIRSYFPDVYVTHIMDVASDKEWSRNVDKTIQALCPLSTVCLYGGRNSFIPHYSGLFSTFELDVINNDEGTKVREQTSKSIEITEDFRKGIIYSCGNQYPKVFPTVDLAVINYKSEPHVLMGEKPNIKGFVFPGGFVNPIDESYEYAAKRELIEECEVSFSPNLKYVCSCRQNDWRYKSNSEKILTVLYKTKYISGNGRPRTDEFIQTTWIALNKSEIDIINETHKELFKALLRSENV